MSRPAPAQTPSDAILTLPNLVTFARLALIPLFIWLALGPKQITAAFIVGGIAGSTDFIDGKLARRLGQVSKLGTAMDPFVDRLLVAAAAVILIVLDFAPLWAVIVVLARDALVLAAVPFLTVKGAERPAVSWWGKSATMGVMWAFGLWIGSHMTSPPQEWMRVLAWIFYVPGVAFSYIAAAGYAMAARRSIRTAGTDETAQ